jgi:hypothetical protein
MRPREKLFKQSVPNDETKPELLLKKSKMADNSSFSITQKLSILEKKLSNKKSSK